MINTFETTFEARERLQQLEKIYQGEAVDLVASITTDGVPQDLTGYSIEGYYQPVGFKGTDDDRTFYAVNAEIAGNKVKVHWTPDKDFGKGPYSIWALLTKEDDESYPVSWRLNLAHSPGYPVGETPEPIPQTIDFSKYTLLNAPWLPLAGGTVTGNLTVTGNEIVGGNVTVTGKFKSQDVVVNDTSLTQVWIGRNAGTAQGASAGAISIGYDAKSNAFGTAIGTAATTSIKGGVALGFGANATGTMATAMGREAIASGVVSIAIGSGSTATQTGSIAVGYGADSTASNAIQIGAYARSDSELPSVIRCVNNTPNSVQIFNKQVFQTTGTPNADPASNNVILVRERAPWAVSFNDVATVATTGSYNDLTDKPDLTVKADKADQFYLPYGAANEQGGNITSLRQDRSVYRMNMSMDPDTGEVIFGNIGTEGIPTKSAYFCFEIEATIPQGATSLDDTMLGVTWVSGHGLPTTGFAGKTLYIKGRLDCTTRTILASCWRVA